MRILLQSTAVVIQFGPFVDKTDGNTYETNLAGTGANQLENTTTGIRISKNGGALAARSATATASTYDALGMYLVTLSTTDTGTLGQLRMAMNNNDALTVWEDFLVVPANIYNSLVLGTDILDVSVTQLLGTAWLTPGVAGTPDVNVKLISGDATAADNCEADYDGTGYVGGTIKKESDMVSIHGTALTETATQLAGAFTKFFDKAAPTGTINSIPDAVAGQASGLAIVGSSMVVPNTQKVDVETIKTQAVTCAAGVTVLPSVGAASAQTATLDTIKTDTAAILVDTGTTLDGRIPAALVSGRMDSSVGAVAANAITAAAIADAAIDNATFAADVGSTAFASNIIALAVFKALDSAITDAVSLTTGGLLEKMRRLTWILTNQIAVTDATGTTKIYKDDDSTVAYQSPAGIVGMLLDNSVTTTRLRAV